MRRVHVVLLVAVVLLGANLIGGSTFATAQDIDPTSHPLIGSWVFDADVEDPENLPELVTIFSDGTVIFSSFDGATGHGSWAPVGETTANLTFLFVFENGNRSLLRFDVGVADDGEAFVASYTNEFFNALDESSGEIGPRVAEGTRIGVAGPGTPVASFEEFAFDEFFGRTEEVPEATPAD